MPNILLLGAGLVTGPFIDYMVRRPENHITIASRTLAKAEELAKGKPNVTATTCNVEDQSSIDKNVAACDVVVSLVPYIHHAAILASAIKHKKNFVSTSYVSPAMQALNDEAVKAGIVAMNEIGVDPGVDHIMAMQVIDDVHAKGGKVLSFISYCGGLPAPECSNNPLGYKFSWSPRGVLLAVRNEAKYKENGKVVTIPGPELLRQGAKRIFTYPAFATFGYPNRDSSFYDTRYGMPECHTCLRGSLRYQGNVEIVQALADIGFLSVDPAPYLQNSGTTLTWRQATAKIIGAPSDRLEDIEATIVSKAKLEGETKCHVLRGLKWFGLLGDEIVAPGNTPLDALCGAMGPKLTLQPGERDMVLLQHVFGIERADGSKYTQKSTLIEYGDSEGYTAMARLVGMPCGVATQLILDGKINKKGIVVPLSKDVYEPLWEELKKENVKVFDEFIE